MKRTIWLWFTFVIVAMLLAAMLSAAIGIKLVRLTVVNKSGYDAQIWLHEKYQAWEDGKPVPYSGQAQYYLPIPWGDREKPYVTVWTLVPSIYEMKIVFEGWGLVEGYESEMELTGQRKLVLVPPGKSGELQCREMYEDLQLLNKCLDSLHLVQGFGDVYKVLPSMWLSRLKP